MSGAENSIQTILKKLDSSSGAFSIEELIRILKTRVGREDLSPWIRFDEEKYARNRIHRGEKYEVLCLCWRPGQKSPPHDHFESTAVIRIISGKASETVFESHGDYIQVTGEQSFRPGEVRAEGPELIHQFGNSPESKEDLITLHVYSPPLPSMDIGNSYEGGRIVPVELPV